MHTVLAMIEHENASTMGSIFFMTLMAEAKAKAEDDALVHGPRSQVEGFGTSFIHRYKSPHRSRTFRIADTQSPTD